MAGKTKLRVLVAIVAERVSGGVGARVVADPEMYAPKKGGSPRG
jgi:hypothetical protein